MKTLTLAALAALTACGMPVEERRALGRAMSDAGQIAMSVNPAPVGPAYGSRGFLQGEIETGGFTKQCVYDHLGDTYVTTVRSTQLCPM